MTKSIAEVAATQGTEDCSHSGTFLRCGVLVLGVLTGPLAVAQTVLYSNLGPGDSFLGGGYGSVPAVANWSLPFPLYQGVGAKFIAGASGQVAAVEAAVQVTCLVPTLPWTGDPCAAPQQIPLPQGASNAMWFTILSDNGGVPGTPLAVSSTAQVGSLHLYTFSFSSAVVLQSGTTYWIRGETVPSQLLLGWNSNNQGINGQAQWGGNFNPNPTFTTYFTDLREPAFRLLAVPEPSQYAMLVVGGLFLMLKTRGRSAR